MSQIAVGGEHPHAGHGPSFGALTGDNVAFRPHAGRGAALGLGVVGIALVAVAGVIGFTGMGGVWARQALAAYHVGTMSVLAMCLGALFLTMVFHLLNAGWTSTIRRQFENVASFLPFAWLLVMPTLIIEIATHGRLFRWLDPSMYADHALAAKAPFFFFKSGADLHVGTFAFPTFFVARALIYGALWTFLSRRLVSLSRQQDTNPGPALSAKARFTSSWGMLAFALSTAFASFDWLMSLDFKFFSTMWGVYYFAGAAFSAPAAVAIILAVLRSKGKLEGVVTSEQFHDLGKIMFSFTVFWAYIAFSQYFLIWYSNMPEETAYYLQRNTGGWQALGIFLMFGHFMVPFLILLFRKVKRTPQLLVIFALLAVCCEVADLYWIVRPMVYAGTAEAPSGGVAVLVDAAAIGGVLLLFAGYLVRKVSGTTLVATGCPYLAESMEHKNYV